MNIKEKKGFITIYTTLAMIFLITIITVSLIMVSRKLRNQAQLNTEIYKAYNQDDMSNIIVDYATEIPIYTKEQFEHLRNWVKNEDRKTEYMLINGYLYKLDAENYEEYKATLRTDLYFDYRGRISGIDIIENNYNISIADDFYVAYVYDDSKGWSEKITNEEVPPEGRITTKFYKKSEPISEGKIIYGLEDKVELIVQENDYSYKLVIEGEGEMPSLGNISNFEFYGYQEGINKLFIEEGATIKEYLLIPYVTEVEISDEITSIGDWAFAGANSLKEIEMPKEVEKIGAYSFATCGFNIMEIPETIEEIDVFAFKFCVKLQKLIIPSNVISIGNNAFQGCESLNELHIKTTNCTYGSNVFHDVEGKINVYISDEVIQEKIEERESDDPIFDVDATINYIIEN